MSASKWNAAGPSQAPPKPATRGHRGAPAGHSSASAARLAASNAQARHHLETLDGNQLVADLGRSAVGRRLPAFDVHKSSVPHTGGRLSWRSLRREVGEKLADECFELAVELGYTYTYSTRHDDAQLWKIGGVAINTTVFGDKGIWTTVSTALQPPVVQSQWS